MEDVRGSSPVERYGSALLCVGAALLLRLILQPLLGEASFHVFTAAVAVAALWGIGPGLLATAVCVALVQAFLRPAAGFSAAAVFEHADTLLFAAEGALISVVVGAARRAAAAERDARQRPAAEELRAAAEDMRAVLDSALDAVVGFDDQGRVTLWNPRAAEIFGWAEAEARGRGLAELVLPSGEREAFRRGLQRFLQSGEWSELGRRLEARALRRDRSQFPIEMSLVARRQGPHWHLNAFVADITERKRVEERELAARQEAEAANRLKDDFLATLSHELRTPLSAIVGWAQVLTQGELGPEDARRAIASIDRNARAQAQLISDLLDVSRVISGKLHLERQPVACAQVVEAALDTVRPSAESKGLELVAELGPGARVHGDPHRLQQVVLNLLTNAVKFTPRGGSVAVRLAAEGEEAVLSVQDTGMGIDPAFLPHVFDRFRQAEAEGVRRQGGLGLGLAIVRHLVELHGGTVEARSPGAGQGTTMVARLPLMAGEAAGAPSPEPGPAAAGTALRPGLHVLLVEDQRDIRDMVGMVLARAGARVSAVSGAEAALAALRREPPDVLLSDLEMPGTDGFTLIREVRALPAGRNIPAAALTGYAREEDRRRALRAGYQMHLAKPVDPLELVAAVAALASMAPPPGASEAAPDQRAAASP